MKEKLLALFATQGTDRPSFEDVCDAYAKAYGFTYLPSGTKSILKGYYEITGLPLSDFIIGDDHKYDSYGRENKKFNVPGLIKHGYIKGEKIAIFIKSLYENKYGEELEDAVLEAVINELAPPAVKNKLEKEIEFLRKELAAGPKDDLEGSSEEQIAGNRVTMICIGSAAATAALSYYYLSFRIKPNFLSPISSLGTAGIFLNLGIGIVFAGGAAVIANYLMTPAKPQYERIDDQLGR